MALSQSMDEQSAPGSGSLSISTLEGSFVALVVRAIESNNTTSCIAVALTVLLLDR